MTKGLPRPKRFKYHVVFSYASADQAYVSAVGAALPEEIEHFDYATDEAKPETWGRNLKKHLKHLYRNEGMFCIVFISKAYLDSEYTQLELEVVSDVARKKPGYVLPVKIDDISVPELDDFTWTKGTMPAEQLAKLIDATIRRPPPKPWWFYVSMPVKVAAAAAVLALILFARPAIDLFRPSRTSIALAAATEQTITAHISNKGPKPSTLVAYRLKFGSLPLEEAELRLAKPDAATIPARGEVDVNLRVLTLEPKCDPEGNRPNNDQIEAMLDRHQVTLEVDVAESDDAPGKATKRTDTFPASRLKPFVRKWVPSDVPPC